MASVTCNLIYKELISTHGKFLDSEKKNLQTTISGPLNLSASLETNFTNMITASASLAAKNVGYQDHVLFDFAYEKLMNNDRTKDILLRYKTRDEFNPSDTSFTHFAKWITAQYDIVKSSLPIHTAASAFYGEATYNSPTPQKADGNVAAAVISPGRNITLTEKEYEELKTLAYSPSPKKTSDPVSRPAPGYCILHGFGIHGPGMTVRASGKPAYCKTMSDPDGKPRPGSIYTKEQIFCKNSKGAPIAGMHRCQDVLTGFTKP